MTAFHAAREDGAVWIETDVKLTQDGVPVLIHDETLERTTDGVGNIADKTWAELQTLDAGAWFGAEFAGMRIPALTEFVAFARDAGLRMNLEIKPCAGRARATTMVALIEVAKIWPESAPPPLISSFDIEALAVAAQLHPAWPRGLLLDEWRDDWVEIMGQVGATTLNLDEELLTAERLEALRPMQIPLLAYTVNDADRARFLLANGVHAVFSDDAGALIKAIR